MTRFIKAAGLALLPLFLLFSSTADAWILIGNTWDDIVQGVVATPEDPEWTSWQFAGDASGDIDDGPQLLTITCNRSWLHARVLTPTWDGDDWSTDLQIRGRDTGQVKSGACVVKYDGATQYEIDYDFE